MNYLKLNRFSHHLQVSFARLNVICRSLYKLCAPDELKYRKNMQGARRHNDHQLMAIRRSIESDFSLLSYYNAENNRARSPVGF